MPQSTDVFTPSLPCPLGAGGKPYRDGSAHKTHKYLPCNGTLLILTSVRVCVLFALINSPVRPRLRSHLFPRLANEYESSTMAIGFCCSATRVGRRKGAVPHTALTPPEDTFQTETHLERKNGCRHPERAQMRGQSTGRGSCEAQGLSVRLLGAPVEHHGRPLVCLQR